MFGVACNYVEISLIYQSINGFITPDRLEENLSGASWNRLVRHHLIPRIHCIAAGQAAFGTFS